MANILKIEGKMYMLLPHKDNTCHGCAFWNGSCELPEDSEVMCDEYLNFKEFIPPTEANEYNPKIVYSEHVFPREKTNNQ